MAHPNVSNKMAVSTLLHAALQLTEEQAKAVDQIEYEFYRSYQFDIPKYHSRQAALYRSLRKLLPVLHRRQIDQLKAIIKDRREEVAPKTMERRPDRDYLTWTLAYFHFLQLTPTQEKLIREITKPGERPDLDQCIARLRPTLEGHQLVALAQHEKEQQRQLREGQADFLQVSLPDLGLNDEQRERIVDFRVENYQRSWLFGEELKEERQLMEKVLNPVQWKTYLVHWDQAMARKEEWLTSVEKDNQFSILWEESLQRYIKDHLHPAWQVYRDELRLVLSDQERHFIANTRQQLLDEMEEITQSAIETHRKEYGDRTPSEVKILRQRLARFRLWPTLTYTQSPAVLQGLREIAQRHQSILFRSYTALQPTRENFKRFMADTYEELGGMYSPNTMVAREEDSEEEREHWGMSFLLLKFD